MQKRGVVIEISHRPWAFAVAFFVLFGITVFFLSLVGATPDPITDTPDTAVHTTNQVATVSNPEAPFRIVATSIGLDANVENPTSTDIDVLDDALTQGAVHYPTSAPLGVDGTVLLFGHSSYLPVVYHQYYKTFDGIQNLKTGAIVSVYSNGTEYRYSVTGVKVAEATSDVIELPQVGKHLTLVTCDSFSDKTNRFVVTADFVGAFALSNTAANSIAN